MATGCGDVLSLEDLKIAKLHQLFEAEVITGRQGGIATGVEIDYATNQVTGQVQKTLPAVLRDAGYEPASFDFNSGGTLSANDRNKAVLWPVSSGGDGDYYYWEGALPKVIPAGSTPSSTGGVAAGAWRPIGDYGFREDVKTGSAQYLKGTLLNHIQRTVKDFNATGGGLVDDSSAFAAADAFSVTSGETIRVPKGDYLIKNITLSGSWSFDDDAYLVGNIAGTDNVILAGTGLRLDNCAIKRTVSSYPTDGDFGNALRIGTYRQPTGGSNHHDIIITRMRIYCLGTINPQAVEMLGDVYDVQLQVDVFGPGGAVIAHWGGDVGTDGHSSAVTYSYHPHNLTLDVGGYPDASGAAPENLLITSACYNVKGVVRSRGVKRSLWAFPGDVYDAVAVARDKGKVCTGIDIEVFADTPVDANGSPAVHLTGMPATPRTNPPASYGVDDTSSFDFKIRASINCGSTAYSNPVCIVDGIDSSDINISRTGSAAGTGPWAMLRYSARLKARMSGWSHQGVLVIGCPGSDIRVDSISPAALDLDSSRGLEIRNFTTGALITQYDIGPGASNAVVNPTTAAVVFAGSYLTYLGVPVARVRKSMLCQAGVNTYVPVEGVVSTVPANASVAFTLPCEGTRFTGCIEGYRNNYVLNAGWGCTLDVSSKRSKQQSIYFIGNYVRGVKIRGNIERTGTQTGGSYADIAVLSTTPIRGLDISCNFDAFVTNPYVSNRFQYNSTDHTGLVIHDCYATGSALGTAFQVSASTVAEVANAGQIYGNKVDDVQAPGSMPTGMLNGTAFVGTTRNTVAPSAGYWNRGSKVYLETPSAGGVEGFVCTASGTPGTWKSFGSISA